MKIENGSLGIVRGVWLFLFSIAYLWLFVRVLYRVGDEGLIIYGAQLVAEGSLPYRDFIDLIGPGSFYWLGFFFKIFGTKFLVARAVLLLTVTATTLLLYWMTRRLYRGPFEWLPAFFCVLMSIPVWPCNSHHWDSNLFALIAVSAFFLWQDKGSPRYLLMAGVVAGLTSCFMQQKGFLLLLAFLIIILANAYRAGGPKSQTLSRVGTLLIGYTGVGVLVILLFYWAGGLSDLIYLTFTFPTTTYYDANVTPYGFGLFKFLFPSWQALFEYYFSRLVSKALAMLISIPFIVIIAIPFFLAILTIGSLFFRANRSRFFDGLMLPYWGAGLALWLSELQRKDINHLAYGSPLLVILFFVTFIKLSENKRLLRNLGMAVIIISLSFYGTYKAMSAAAANVKITTRRGIVHAFGDDTALRFLQKAVQAREEVFIYPYYPMYYFLANVKNPTRFNVMMHWPNTEEMFNEAGRELDRKKVKYVLWDTFADGVVLKNWFPAYRQPPEEKLVLERYMTSHYEMIGLESGWRILRRLDGS